MEVARPVETVLLMIGIDYLIRDDHASNPILDDFVIDYDDELDVNSVARDSNRSNFPNCFTHAVFYVPSGEFPRRVLQASIVLSCGLAKFERTSGSTQRRHQFWGSHEELHTGADHDKYVGSFEDNYFEICKGRSIWMIVCRKFHDPDCDRSFEDTRWLKSEGHEAQHEIQELP